jgi:cytochrome b561
VNIVEEELAHTYNVAARQRTTWQWALFVLAPLALTLLLIVLATVWIDYGPQSGPGSRPVLAHVATIFFTTLLCFLNLVPLVVFAALSAGIVWLMLKLPPVFKRVHDLLVIVSARVQQVTASLAGALIKAHGLAAGMRQFARRLRARR